MQPFTKYAHAYAVKWVFQSGNKISPQKTISNAFVSIVLSRVTPGIIKSTLFALIHFAYLFTYVCAFVE